MKKQKSASLSEAKLKELFDKEIEKVSVTKEEEREYFRELYDLFEQSAWREYDFRKKLKFFRDVSIYVNEHYVKAYNKAASIKSLLEDSSTLPPKELSKLKKTYSILLEVSYKYLGVPIEKNKRNSLLASLRGFFAPVLVVPSEEADKLIDSSKLKSAAARRILVVDIRHSLQKETLPQLESILKAEQKRYFEEHPEERKAFIKVKKNEREDVYPFDEWDRYLKIYMLKRSGKTNKEIAAVFFQKSDPYNAKRVVLRDSGKAKDLSHKALIRNFPV